MGSVDVEIDKIECDSRQILPGDLFVAICGGEEQDRHQFISHALERGARAIVAEREVDSGSATRIVVENCRQGLARLAACFYNYPDRELLMVGITGTNGKTTTALLARQILEAAEVRCGYVGTLGSLVDVDWEETDNTTPEAKDLHQMLRKMVESGKSAAVLEVSSHGLALDRVAGLRFKAGVFTNLTRDHLDFHQSEENYFNAKARLFEGLDDEGGSKAIVNVDDASAPKLLERVTVPTLTYGRQKDAHVRLGAVEQTEKGTRLHLRTPLGAVEVESHLKGGFNCYNILAAFSVGLALEMEPEAICQGIAAVRRVPGRCERILAGQGFEVIVDYAHTPDALDRLLRMARESGPRRLACVFGCGGDRDPGKRSLMGSIASAWADQVYLTSDNPRSESPEKIISEIVKGVSKECETQIFTDRREAIQVALSAAAPGDYVVIAGKGHESVQKVGDAVIEFDDRRVAHSVLRSLGHHGRVGKHGAQRKT
jgi:UDP-N-acetylmuramoyl-L-alanyl-D-glutamate--2,6-diaminopimelate ligase